MVVNTKGKGEREEGEGERGGCFVARRMYVQANFACRFIRLRAPGYADIDAVDALPQPSY